MKTHTERAVSFDRDGLDLSAFNLRAVGGQLFARKADAVSFAGTKGWLRSDVVKASNRFNVFWVVGQWVDAQTFRVLGSDGWVDLAFGAEVPR